MRQNHETTETEKTFSRIVQNALEYFEKAIKIRLDNNIDKSLNMAENFKQIGALYLSFYDNKKALLNLFNFCKS